MWGVRFAIPPMRTEPASVGLRGSETSYCRSSPVPQHATYRKRSSSDRSMSVTSGGTAPKPLSSGGRSSAGVGSAGIVMVFSMWNLPSSRHQVQIEPSRLVVSTTTPTRGIVGRPHLKRHLVIGTEIDGLHVAAAAQVPKVDLMAIAVAEQVFGHDAVLELRRQPPLARYHVVARQVPPEIIVELLRPAIDLPAPEHLEGFAVHDEHAGRTVGAVRARAPERTDVDALGTAMDGVGPRVPGLA